MTTREWGEPFVMTRRPFPAVLRRLLSLPDDAPDDDVLAEVGMLVGLRMFHAPAPVEPEPELAHIPAELPAALARFARTGRGRA